MDGPSKTAVTVQPTSGDADARPVGAIVGELWHNTETLVRQEMQLGLALVDKRVTELKVAAFAAAVSGALIYAGLLAVLAAVILLIAKFIDPWLSALLVGGCVSGVGYALMPRAKSANAEVPSTSASSDKHAAFKENRT